MSESRKLDAIEAAVKPISRSESGEIDAANAVVALALQVEKLVEVVREVARSKR